MGLFQKKSLIFSFSTSNALLEFLLEGAPQVREHLKGAAEGPLLFLFFFFFFSFRFVSFFFIATSNRWRRRFEAPRRPPVEIDVRGLHRLQRRLFGRPHPRLRLQGESLAIFWKRNVETGTILEPKAESYLKNHRPSEKAPPALKEQSFAQPETVKCYSEEAQKYLRTRLPVVQRSLQLYLANRETEFILFRCVCVFFFRLELTLQ